VSDDRWWHGGAPGLRAGDLIEPRSDDDGRHLVDGCPECEARRTGGTLMPEGDGPRPDRIYITRDRTYARLYAAGYPRGALYTVEPLGPLESTANADPIESFAVPAARVLKVYDPLVTLTASEWRRMQRLADPHESWVTRLLAQ
jgi:hypothetical protein